MIAAATFFFYREPGKETFIHKPQPGVTKKTEPKERTKPLPEVAIVIDDLGPSKKAVLEVFNINASLTFSILPLETYTKWIAEEAYRLGYDVIGHIPMEASKPHSLGKGGLYTWMTDNEILDALAEDLDSIPHIKGISNHMGSAFTEDERTMYVLMSGIKERGLFYLDSLTTPASVGSRIAREHGIKVLIRDIFLDYKDSPRDIETQWKKLIGIARKKGYAIAIAHPKNNTIEFLKKTLPSNQVTVVPLSEFAGFPQDIERRK